MRKPFLKTGLVMILVLLGGLTLIQCTKEDDGVNCDSKVGELQYIFVEKQNEYSSKATIANCNAAKKAFNDFYYQMKECGISTVSFENAKKGFDSADCSAISENLTGTVTVWTKLTVGTLTVICNGQTKYITSYYSLSPSCDASGCASFTVPYGNYTLSASGPNNYLWTSATFKLDNSCFKMELKL